MDESTDSHPTLTASMILASVRRQLPKSFQIIQPLLHELEQASNEALPAKLILIGQRTTVTVEEDCRQWASHKFTSSTMQ